MKQPECPKCRAPLIWDGADAVAACPQCGTQYKMHPRRAVQPVLMPRTGRGVVDYLTVPNESIIRNRPLLRSYIPKGWAVSCSLAGDRFDLVSNPFVMSVIYDAPDNSARIIYTGECFYKHIDYTQQTAMLQNRLEDLTVSRTPSFLRLKSYHTADEYCDSLVQNSGCSSLSVLRAEQPDEAELSVENLTVNNFASKGFSDVAADWAGKTYRGFSRGGQPLKLYAETRLVQMSQYSNVPSVQMQPQFGFFGMRMAPQMGYRQQLDYYWYTAYELLLIATEASFDSAREELRKIWNSLDALPGMEQARADAMALANRTLANIGQAQSQSFDRQRSILADTQAYTTGVMREINQSNAATHNRVANMQSEMINEVNTFHTKTGGVVQASTQYDHVYQNTRYPDWYAAQEGNAFEFGVDFEELDKTNGDY